MRFSRPHSRACRIVQRYTKGTTLPCCRSCCRVRDATTGGAHGAARPKLRDAPLSLSILTFFHHCCRRQQVRSLLLVPPAHVRKIRDTCLLFSRKPTSTRYVSAHCGTSPRLSETYRLATLSHCPDLSCADISPFHCWISQVPVQGHPVIVQSCHRFSRHRSKQPS